MTKPTLKSAIFNPDTGISTVVLQTKDGEFTGTAKLHPEDQNHASRYTGCKYAEIRANIKIIKFEKKVCRRTLKELTDIYTQIYQNRNCSINSREAQYLTTRMNEILKELEKLEQAEDKLNSILHDLIIGQEKTNKLTDRITKAKNK